MPILAKDTGGGDFEKAPTGTQQAVCVFVFDIGWQKGEYAGVENILPKIIVCWESVEIMTTGEFAGKPFMLSKYYTLSLHEKANLRKDLESWRGKAFTPEELDGFDVERLVGANCLLNVVATEKDKRKISAIMPLPKGMSQIKPTITDPTENIKKWIEKERAKAITPNHVQTSSSDSPRDEDVPPF
jgi:hypothetical protein